MLGELSKEERISVEQNLVTYPELKAALDRVEEAQELFLMRTAIKPRPDLRTKVLEAVKVNGELPKIVSFYPSPSVTFWKFAAAASIAIAFISSYLAYSYHTNWKQSQSELSGLIAQNQRIAQDYNQVNQRLDNMENELKLMDNPSFQRVVMKGTANAPESLASVYWNESSSEVYLKIRSMKELSRGNQYQLWAIIDGKPVDVGVFDANLVGVVKMKGIPKGAVTFAVTIEPRGGKSSPTLETMQVAGQVVKG